MNPPPHAFGRAPKRVKVSHDAMQSTPMEPRQSLPPSALQPLTRAPSPCQYQSSLFTVARGASSSWINRRPLSPHAISPTFENFEYRPTVQINSSSHRGITVSSQDASNGSMSQGTNESMTRPRQIDHTANEIRPFSETPVAGCSSEDAYPYSSAFDTEEYPWDFVSQAGGICDTSECAAETCDTCDSCEQSCYLPCNDAGECSSGSCQDQTCFNQSCLGDSQPSSTDHQTTLPNQCEWVGNGENCPAIVQTPGEKVEHVTESHIKPQTQVTCQWDSCGIPTNVQQLPDHLWSDHFPAPEPEMYSCLWQGCELKSATHQGLDDHFKTAHVYLNCHWAGCEMSTANQQELQQHFNQNHIHFNDSNQHDPFANQHLLPDPSQESLRSQSQALPIQHKSTQEPTPPAESQEISESDPQKSELDDPKVCEWQDGPENNPQRCGLIFKDGNQLQDHIRLDHIRNLKPDELQCRWPGCTYTQTAKDKSKLNRHTCTHTGYCYGACQRCGQEFSDKSKLKQHEATHLDKKPFPCGKCGRRFPSQNALTNHERTHKGEKPLVCGMMVKGERCSYRCSDPSNLSTHKKKHSPPQYKCAICERAFCRSDTLKRHMITHSSKRPAGRKRGFTQLADVMIKHPE